MSLDQDGLQQALAQWSDDPLLKCLTFEHPDLATPIRLVANTVAITRSAGEFMAWPFDLRAHVRADDSMAEASIVLDAVDQQVILALQGIVDERPTVTYEAVLASSPNTVQEGPMVFTVHGFTRPSPGIVQISCAFAIDFAFEQFPKDYFSPANASAA